MTRAALRVPLLVVTAGALLAGLFEIQHTLAGGRTAGRKVRYYVDPMHPEYKSDKPGIAPDCGMQLDPVYADDVTNAPAAPTAQAGAINLSAAQQQRIGVAVSTVEESSGTHILRLFGRVAADETKIYRLVAGMDGIARDLSAVTTGSIVSKDQWLATFSAPELRAPLQGYLITLDVMESQKKGGAQAPSQIKAAEESSRQALDRLLNLGISPVQVKELERTRVTPTDLMITAPAAGIVVSRNLSLGQRFDKGTEWFRIADLNRIWILADVFEQDARYIRPGQPARVTLASGGPALNAKVSNVPPQFDPNSRTFKVRLEMENPGYTFRPDMFADVQLAIALPASISVPVDAILDSGLRKTVFVDRGDGNFEPREVETGWRFDERVQIIRGLQAGERIVTSANFLLDSEARMRQAATGGHSAAVAGKDPVCGMTLSSGRTPHELEYGGERFYFCSDQCQHKFEKDAAAYTHKSMAAMAHSGAEMEQ